MADLLDLTPAGRAVSSPYVRCMQTVEPLAARHRKPVQLARALAEEAAVENVVRQPHRLPDGSIACTHGDMLQELISVVDTLDWRADEISFDKGGVWVLRRDGQALSLVEQLQEAPGPLGDRPVMMSSAG